MEYSTSTGLWTQYYEVDAKCGAAPGNILPQAGRLRWLDSGAGEGNRTLTSSLGSSRSATELLPLRVEQGQSSTAFEVCAIWLQELAKWDVWRLIIQDGR